MSSAVGGTEDVIFHHVPDRTSFDEGWVKRKYRVYALVLGFECADVGDSMTVYIMSTSTFRHKPLLQFKKNSIALYFHKAWT